MASTRSPKMSRPGRCPAAPEHPTTGGASPGSVPIRCSWAEVPHLRSTHREHAVRTPRRDWWPQDQADTPRHRPPACPEPAFSLAHPISSASRLLTSSCAAPEPTQKPCPSPRVLPEPNSFPSLYIAAFQPVSSRRKHLAGRGPRNLLLRALKCSALPFVNRYFSSGAV